MKETILFFITAIYLALSAQSVSAFEIDQMTDTERAAFRAEIREYLMDNPEVIYEAVEILRAKQAQAAENQDKKLVQLHSKAIFEDGFSYNGGNPEGDITLVEFVDYKCGYCKRAHTEVEALLAEDSNVKFIIKEFPILGDASVTTSQFAIAVHQLYGDVAYKSVHDILLSFTGQITSTALNRIANTLGLDQEAIFDHMNNDKVIDVIRQNRELGQILEITGTPTFILGDEMLRGFVPADALITMIADMRR